MLNILGSLNICKKTQADLASTLQCLIQSVIFSTPKLKNGVWVWEDQRGQRDDPPLESVCLLGDGIVTIQFPAGLETTSFTYFNGTADIVDSTDGSGQWLIPNATNVGDIRFETSSPYANWFLADDNSGTTTLYNRVSGGNNATLSAGTVWDTNNSFTSLQNEVGYSDGGGGVRIPAQIDSTGDYTGLDASGGILDYKLRVRYDVKIVNSSYLDATGGETLTNPNIGSWTISGYTGALPTKVGTTITLGAGGLSELILNDGSIDHTYTIGEGNLLTIYDKSPTNSEDLTLSADIWDNDTTATIVPDNLNNDFEYYDDDATHTSVVRVPYKTDGTAITPTISLYSKISDNLSGAWNNYSESEVENYPSNQMISADNNLSVTYLFTGGVPNQIGYNDMVNDVLGENVVFSNVNTDLKRQEMVVVDADYYPPSADCLEKIYNIVGHKWILATGIWNDNGIWTATGIWKSV